MKIADGTYIFPSGRTVVEPPSPPPARIVAGKRQLIVPPVKRKIDTKPSSDVTVVITNYGRPAQLLEAFRSCQAAGVENLVVSSNAVTPQIRDVHRTILESKPNAVITATNEDTGCNACWLRGVLNARTPKVMILHDDDMVTPEFRDAVSGKLSKYDFVHWDGVKHGTAPPDILSGVYVTRPDLPEGEWPATYLLSHLLKHYTYTVSPVSGMFPRDHLIDVLSECESNFGKKFMLRPTMMVGNDLLIWLRACEKYKSFYYSHKPLCSYGHWDGSASYSDAVTQRGELLPIYQETRAYWYGHMTKMWKISHVVQRYNPTEPGEIKRIQKAQDIAQLGYSLGIVRAAHQWSWNRDSGVFGCKRRVPFVRDVLQLAMDSVGEREIIALTNDDSILNVFGWLHAISEVPSAGALCSFRREIQNASAVSFSEYPSTPHGRPHYGRDAWFFTKDWLQKNILLIPDYVFAHHDFDSTIDMAIRLSKGVMPKEDEFLVERPESNMDNRFLYHESHHAEWCKKGNRRSLPGNIYNRKLSDEWFPKHLGWKQPDLGAGFE